MLQGKGEQQQLQRKSPRLRKGRRTETCGSAALQHQLLGTLTHLLMTSFLVPGVLLHICAAEKNPK